MHHLSRCTIRCNVLFAWRPRRRVKADRQLSGDARTLPVAPKLGAAQSGAAQRRSLLRWRMRHDVCSVGAMTTCSSFALALGVLSATLGISQAALACGSLPVVLCTAGTLTPADAALPANAVQWRWVYPGSPGLDQDAGLVQPRLFLVAGGQRSELPLAVTALSSHVALLASERELPVGSVVELGYSYRCYAEEERVSSTVSVAPAAPTPTTLGSLKVPAAEVGSIAVGACGESLEAAYVDLTVVLSPDAAPYRSALSVTLRLDGMPASARSYAVLYPAEEAPAPDLGVIVRVFAPCGAQLDSVANLPLGRHRVQVVGTLTDGTSVVSNERELELRCDATAAGTDAGIIDAGASSSPPDAGHVMRPADASIRSPAEASPLSPQASTAEDEGCAVGASGGAGGWLALVAMLLRQKRKAGSGSLRA
jgi:hypothetical protein